VEEQPVRLLESAGAAVVPWEMDQECCGFGGLFSVKAPEVSVAMADRKLDTLPDVETVVSADGGCLLHLDGRARRRNKRIHFQSLASTLWEARDGRA
jgi:L-lactate dehydrogenase complex protein LldE